jgi:hypothetical protein
VLLGTSNSRAGRARCNPMDVGAKSTGRNGAGIQTYWHIKQFHVGYDWNFVSPVKECSHTEVFPWIGVDRLSTLVYLRVPVSVGRVGRDATL